MAQRSVHIWYRIETYARSIEMLRFQVFSGRNLSMREIEIRADRNGRKSNRWAPVKIGIKIMVTMRLIPRPNGGWLVSSSSEAQRVWLCELVTAFELFAPKLSALEMLFHLATEILPLPLGHWNTIISIHTLYVYIFRASSSPLTIRLWN